MNKSFLSFMIICTYFVLFFTTMADGFPYSFSYGGRITYSNGAPLQGPIDISVSFFNSVDGNDLISQPVSIQNVKLDQGVFQIEIILSDTQFNTIFPNSAQPVYIEVSARTLSGEVFVEPRQKFSFVPYALKVPTDSSLVYDSQGLLGVGPQAQIKLSSTGTNNQIVLKAPASMGVQTTYTLPSVIAADQFLKTDSNGNLSWATPAGGGGGPVSSAMIVDGTIMNVDISASAAIDWSKMASLTASRALVSNASGAVSVSNVTSNELNYLSGTTSSIQTQLNNKESSIAGGTTTQYFRGDKTWQTLDTASVVEGTNKYFTDTRARNAAVADTIQDGVTNIAPSENAVFDALALKSDVGHSHAGMITGAAGANGQIQFNNNGSFAGNSNLVWDNTNHRLGVGTAPSYTIHSSSSVPDFNTFIENDYTSAGGSTNVGGMLGLGYTTVTSGTELGNTIGVVGEADFYGPGTLKASLGVAGYSYAFSNGTLSLASGGYFQTQNSSTSATITNARGVSGVVSVDSGTITNAFGGFFAVENRAATNITDARGLYVDVSKYSSGTIATAYGLYIADMQAITGYGVYQAGSDDKNYFAGNLGIATSNPATTLDVNGTMRLAKNSSQPYACDLAHDGAIALTSTYRLCCCKNGSGWVYTSDGVSACSW